MFLLPHSVGGTTLHRKLGTGGVAESYLRTQEAGRQVVVRRLLPFVLRDPARLASIEARILDLLGVRHPFLVHVVDHLTEGEDQFLVEEYVNGVTLEQVLTWCRQSGHIVPHNVFLNIATQICNGLEALHGRSGKGSSAEHVLHLSLKPSSIFLTPEGKVLVGGYGLTRSPTTFPQGGVAAPVPARMEYLSPEQTHPDQKLTPASDVFALGAMLYELLTLESLFRAESNLQTIHRVRRAEVTAPLLRVKERMPGLDKVLFRALSLNPRHRYQRAFVLREDLRGLMAGYSFATISEDTRAFLQPIVAGAAAPAAAGYVVGLDDAPASPEGADEFEDSPNTRIDPDPMTTAAHAAAALAERVARERAAVSAPDNTDRTDAAAEAELPPLPKPPNLAAIRTPIPPVPTAAPTWSPDGDTLRDLGPPSRPLDPLPPRPGPEPVALDPSRSDMFPMPMPAIGPPERASGSGKNKRKKERPLVAVADAPSAEVARTASPTLAPAVSPFAPPAEAALPPMVAPPPAPAPTLEPAPSPVPPGEGTVATPAPAAVHPPPAPPPRQLSPQLLAALGNSPVRGIEPLQSPAPPDPLDEAPPPNRGPLFATVTLTGLAAVLLCSGFGYWAYGRYSATVVTPPTLASAAPTVVAPPAPGAAADAESVLASAPAPAPEAAKPAAPKLEAPPPVEPAKPAPTPPAPKVEAPKPAPPPVKVEPPKPKPAPAPVAKVEPPKPKPAPAPVARVEPPKPKPAPVAKVEPPKPKPAPAPVAKVEPPKPKPAASSTARSTPATAAPDASLAVTPEPESPSLDGFVADARAGRLSSVDVTALESTAATDSQFTRSRALLLMNAQKKNDDAGVKKYLDQALSLPENQYNPVFLADYARWHVNRGEWDKALEKASTAERYWARLPSDLVFVKKAEIYEVEASAWQGKFYKSEDPELLDKAVRAWERYRDHAGTKARSDLVKRADEQLTKLNDVRGRMQ